MGFFSKLFGFGGGDSSSKEKTAPKADKKDLRADNPRRNRNVGLEDLEGFVEFVAKSLVDFPDEVKVCSESTKDGKMIKIICLPGDRGKIIGKKGKTIMALRTLVAGSAGRSQERISVEVPDDVEAVKG